MAGRLTLIKSVLNSIPIHTLSALPVPKGTLDAIDRLLRSFLWSSGGTARRHWVNWKMVCTDLSAGGLGVRPLSHMMTALRGKMAWNFLSNDSLWAKHARSRYNLNGKGSYLWKNISPFITSIALDSHWKLGNGDTLAGVFCQSIAMSCPRSLRNLPIRDVLSDPNRRRILMHNVSPLINLSIRDVVDGSGVDKLIWNKDPSGYVTTKSFMKTFISPTNVVKKFEVIWQKWLPPKVSCFLWKILHRALPTDDNIIRVGINLVSKCICCSTPECESMDHLFIHGDMAYILWGTICPLFRYPKPGSLKDFFFHWGVQANMSKFSNLFAFGIACLSLWDIWKIRNSNIYDEGIIRFSKMNIRRCALSLSRCIPTSCRHDLASRRVCSYFGFTIPLIQDFKIFWIPWRPYSVGNTCNIAIHTHGNLLRIAAIIRNNLGEFNFAFKASTTDKHFLKSLYYMLNELYYLGQKVSCICSSQEEILLLCQDCSVDWDIFRIKRKLALSLASVAVYKVSFSLNKAAEALCYSSIDSLRTTRKEDLPLQVQAIILHDGSLHPCSSVEQQVFF